MIVLLSPKQGSYVDKKGKWTVYEESTPENILRELKEIDSDCLSATGKHFLIFQKGKAPADAEFSVKNAIV